MFSLFFAAPPKTEAVFVPTLDSFNLAVNSVTSQATFFVQNKEAIFDGIMYMAKQAIINTISKQMLSWFGMSGADGGPMFVTDINGRLTQISQTTAGNFLDSGSLSNACGYLRTPLIQAISAQYSDPYSSGNDFASRIRCTLDSATGGESNTQAFMAGDFNQGGWSAWLTMTQQPQNNPYGSYLLAQQKLSADIGTKQSALEQEMQRNQGFEDVKDANGKVVMPGSVAREQLNQVLSSPLRQLENADEMNEIVGVMASQLMNMALQKGISELNRAGSSILQKAGVESLNLDAVVSSGNLSSLDLNILIDSYNGSSDGDSSGRSYLDDFGSENTSNSPLRISQSTIDNTITRMTNVSDASGNLLLNKNTDLSLVVKKSAGGMGTGVEAIDGVTNGNIPADMSKASISIDKSPFWQIDLGRPKSIAYITIYRVAKSGTDTMWDGSLSMGAFDVMLYDNDPDTNPNAVLVQQKIISEMKESSMTITLGETGRFLRIVRRPNIDGTNQMLMLAEVAIYEKPGQ